MLSICCVLAERLKKFQVGRFLLGWLGWLSFKFLLGWQSFKVPSWLAKLQSSYLVGKASRFLLGWQSFTWFLLGWQSFTWFLLGKASLGSYLAKLHLVPSWLSFKVPTWWLATSRCSGMSIQVWRSWEWHIGVSSFQAKPAKTTPPNSHDKPKNVWFLKLHQEIVLWSVHGVYKKPFFSTLR